MKSLKVFIYISVFISLSSGYIYQGGYYPPYGGIGGGGFTSQFGGGFGQFGGRFGQFGGGFSPFHDGYYDDAQVHVHYHENTGGFGNMFGGINQRDLVAGGLGLVLGSAIQRRRG